MDFYQLDAPSPRVLVNMKYVHLIIQTVPSLIVFIDMHVPLSWMNYTIDCLFLSALKLHLHKG